MFRTIGYPILAALMLGMAPNAAFAEGRIAALDPGHGGYEVGIRSGGLVEKDTVFAVAEYVSEILRAADWDVFLTRRADDYVSITDRGRLADTKGPMVFISIHLSDSPDFKIILRSYKKNGSETRPSEYYSEFSRQRPYLAGSAELAGRIREVLAETYDAAIDNERLPLPLLGYVAAPAVMLEAPASILDSPDREREIMRLASAIAISVMYYERDRK